MSKLITVVGSTGNQGGSVIKSILNDPELSKEYKIRGITREPSKPSGEKLKSQGVDVVKADLEDKESLKKVFEGAYAVFGVTNFWESASKAVEVGQGRNIADAAKEAGVSVLIWSSLPHVTTLTDGKLPHVEHFDGKAEIGEYARSIGLPTVEFQAGFFLSNLKTMIRKDEGGDSYTLAWPLLPDTDIDFFDAANDTGKFVAGILANPEPYIGKEVLGTTAKYTPNDVCKEFEAVTGKECKYVQLTDDQFKEALPFPPSLKQEFLENFILMRDYGYYGKNAQQALGMSQKVPRGKLTTLSEAIKEMGPW